MSNRGFYAIVGVLGVAFLLLLVWVARSDHKCKAQRRALTTLSDSVAYLYRCGSPNSSATPVILPLPIQH